MFPTAQVSTGSYPRQERIELEEDITVSNVTFTRDLALYYHYYPAWPGTREMPAEPAQVDLNKALVCNEKGQPVTDITPILSDEAREALEDLILDARNDK